MDWTHAKTGKHAVAVGIFAHCFMDYNLVMATPFGLPIGTSSIRKALNDLIREHDLPPVYSTVFVIPVLPISLS